MTNRQSTPSGGAAAALRSFLIADVRGYTRYDARARRRGSRPPGSPLRRGRAERDRASRCSSLRGDEALGVFNASRRQRSRERTDRRSRSASGSASTRARRCLGGYRGSGPGEILSSRWPSASRSAAPRELDDPVKVIERTLRCCRARAGDSDASVASRGRRRRLLDDVLARHRLRVGERLLDGVHPRGHPRAARTSRPSGGVRDIQSLDRAPRPARTPCSTGAPATSAATSRMSSGARVGTGLVKDARTGGIAPSRCSVAPRQRVAIRVHGVDRRPSAQAIRPSRAPEFLTRRQSSLRPELAGISPDVPADVRAKLAREVAGVRRAEAELPREGDTVGGPRRAVRPARAPAPG